MANENQYYKFTFAELGNYSVIPDQASSGNVDYESGFGPDYEKVGGEAERKLIERETFNGLMQGVTKNLKQWQESNYPTWIEDNGDGAPFTYIEGSVVEHNGSYWVATEDADVEPSDSATTWRKFKPNSSVEISGEGGSLTQSLTQTQSILDKSIGVSGNGGNLTQSLSQVQTILNNAVETTTTTLFTGTLASGESASLSESIRSFNMISVVLGDNAEDSDAKTMPTAALSSNLVINSYVIDASEGDTQASQFAFTDNETITLFRTFRDNRLQPDGNTNHAIRRVYGVTRL